MKVSTQGEGISAHSYALQKILGRKGAATKSWLRLRAAVIAAAVAVLLILGTGAAQPAQAQAESVLHSFGSTSGDGGGPQAGLIRDPKTGDYYGTTAFGGSSTNCGSSGCGTVFELVYNSSTNSWTENVLHNFGVKTGDGEGPVAGLIMDSSGNLYGTTEYGGDGYVPGVSSSGEPRLLILHGV